MTVPEFEIPVYVWRTTIDSQFVSLFTTTTPTMPEQTAWEAPSDLCRRVVYLSETGPQGLWFTTEFIRENFVRADGMTQLELQLIVAELHELIFYAGADLGDEGHTARAASAVVKDALTNLRIAKTRNTKVTHTHTHTHTHAQNENVAEVEAEAQLKVATRAWVVAERARIRILKQTQDDRETLNAARIVRSEFRRLLESKGESPTAPQ